MSCIGFCSGGKETRLGLKTNNDENLEPTFKKVKKVEKLFDGYKCPLGFTHNPTNEKATINVIKNGGRHSICAHNPWKWVKI